jgi:gliding motility-associated protein GldE
LDIDWLLRIGALIICLIASAFFSGSEIALFSFDKKKIREFKKEHKIVGGYIQVLLDNPRRLLVTILLGNTLVNTSASIIGVIIAIDAAKIFGLSVEAAVLIQIILLTAALLFIGEITPKLWANKYPMQFAKLVSVPLYWVSIIFYPVAKLLTDILRITTSRLNRYKSKTILEGAEFTELAELGIENGTIEEEEHVLIQGIVSFKTVTAREVMTPRVDISAVAVDADFDTLMDVITSSGHSRIPLYENNLDKIVGVVFAKDLLPYLKNTEIRKTMQLKNIAREIIFVPETKLINDLLHDFQEKNIHLGIVVDEYGGTAGLISLEDILEEIVGDIRDEYDKEENSITRLNENSFVVLGKVSIDELNELLGEDFSSDNDDYDTVGGFIFNNAGMIPTQGFNFIHNNYKFTVKEVINKRVDKVLIEKIQHSSVD